MNILQSLFQPQPTASHTPDDTLNGWIQLLLGMIAEVPRSGLSPKERSALQGYGFLEADLMCCQFERGLRTDPAAFPELPGEAERLGALGRRVVLWTVISSALRSLAQLASDQVLLNRAERVRSVLRHLKHYRVQDQVPWNQGPLTRRRGDLLLAASWTLSAWQKRIRRRTR